jgi:radical SAM protein with 4Fe4S-binding SPASM domain
MTQGFELVQLNTNGVLLSLDLARQIEPFTRAINVSLDGATPEVNDAIRGAGVFERVMGRLRTLGSGGFPMHKICLRPTVTRQNCESLDEILEVAAGLGAQVSFGFFTPTGRGRCNQDAFRIPTEALFSLFERTGERERQLRHLPLGATDSAGTARVKTGCNIEGVAAVDAQGAVYPCPNLMFPEFRLGLLADTSDPQLRELLVGEGARKALMERTVDNVPGCSSCDFRYFCGGGCMANAYACAGDLFAPDPYCGFYQAVFDCHGPLTRPVPTRREA